jgi:hypothetical protein
LLCLCVLLLSFSLSFFLSFCSSHLFVPATLRPCLGSHTRCSCRWF